MKLSLSPLWSTRSEVAKRASYQSCKIFSNVEKEMFHVLQTHVYSKRLSTWDQNMYQEKKKFTMVNFLIFVQKNVSRIRFQEIKIRPLKGFEKMRFLCFYIIGV